MKRTLLLSTGMANDQNALRILLLTMLAIFLIGPQVSAKNIATFGDVENEEAAFTVDGGTIAGGPFEFCVGDGIADNVSGVTLECNSTVNSQWVVTDEDGRILGLPPKPEAVNFDGAGAGVCLIWHLSYVDGLTGLESENNVSDLMGTYDFSNSIRVYRNQPEAGVISGGPYNFTVDGTPDMVSGISLDGTGAGSNSSWVITDEQGNILGLPPTLEAVEGVDFDGAGPGTCLIWYLRFEDGLQGAEMGLNANDLIGCFSLSNPLSVVRSAPVRVDGGFLTGGPFEFCVGDGEVDNVSGIDLECESNANRQWVITDEQGKILGLPPTLEAVEGVDFDGAGPGICLIWHLSYADGLEGLEKGNNATTDLVGNFDFSNSVRVYRNQPSAGTISGGPYYFTVDGTPDMVSGIELDGTVVGSNSSWVITDEQGNILGLPPTLEAVEGVDFDGAGAGTCLIWYLRYEDGLEGAAMGENANDLMGCFSLSNPIKVVRTAAPNAGMISGGPFNFCVDGTPDMVSGIELDGTGVGSNSSWVITDDQGNILGLPPTLEAVEGVDFDGAGAGICLIWYLRYEDGLEGAEMGLNANDLKGNFSLSNPLEVIRSKTDAGTISGGPYYFTVDGTPDMVSGIELDGTRVGSNSSWVITDEQGNILGLPPTLEAVEGVDFDGAGAGTCLIWYLRYEDGLEGAAMGENANDLMGCFSLSNPIKVVRTAEVVGGKVAGGPFEFCVGDGEADNVYGVTVSGNEGANSQWVVTDENGKILGLPPAPEAVDFDGAGAGVCLIWHLSYADGLIGLEKDGYVSDLKGMYDFSNEVRVYRHQPAGGILSGGPFEFTVGDKIPDYVSGIELTENSGSNSAWIVTDEDGKILGLPGNPEEVNFDGAGVGTCLIWHISYEDGLEGLEKDGNAATGLFGCYSLSNSIKVIRTDGSDGKTRVSLYPMPSTDVLNISMGNNNVDKVNVALFDLSGNNVTGKMNRINSDELSYDVQSLNSGTYVLRVYTNTGSVINKKVIIQ